MSPYWYKNYLISKQMGEKRKLISTSRISASKCRKNDGNRKSLSAKHHNNSIV